MTMPVRRAVRPSPVFWAIVALTVAALMWWAIREPGSRLLTGALIALMVVPLPAAAGAIDTFIAAASPGIIDLIGLALTGIIGWAAAAARKKWGIEIEARYREALQTHRHLLVQAGTGIAERVQAFVGWIVRP